MFNSTYIASGGLTYMTADFTLSLCPYFHHHLQLYVSIILFVDGDSGGIL